MQIQKGHNFAASVATCPKLKSFTGYKCWGLGDAKQELYLPECTTIDLERSDDLTHLDLWAPKLEILRLQHCYDLTFLKLEPQHGAPVKVNLFGTELPKKFLQQLKQHPRVGKERISFEADLDSDSDCDDLGSSGDQPSWAASEAMLGQSGLPGCRSSYNIEH